MQAHDRRRRGVYDSGMAVQIGIGGQLGRMVERRLAAWGKVFRFAGIAIVGALSPSTYNSATRLVVQKQIYFTAWEILPGFTALAAVLSWLISSIVVHEARDFGLYDYALEMVIRVLVLEILPLTTVLFVALRTGAAINTEVALMKINNELEALRRSGVDPFTYELIPRVIGGTTSVLALTAVSIVVALLISNAVVLDTWPLALPTQEFSRVAGKVLGGSAMVLLGAKTLVFGLAVTVIPIAEALESPQKLFHAPISVLRGMVRLFFAIMFIEIGALAVAYA
jgi:phospholipid/cholesterol/gamma-HCH transport system permease protein